MLSGTVVHFISLKKCATSHITAMRINPHGHSPASFQSPQDNAHPEQSSPDENRRQIDSESQTLPTHTPGNALQSRLLEQLQNREPSKEEYLAQWNRWAEAGGDDGGNRAEAVRRVSEWFSLNCPEQPLFLCRFDLTDLPDAFPGWLQKLDVRRNRLTSLPTLPVSLKRLTAEDNRLTSLPALPTSLEVLRASNNPLASLPENILTLSNECYIYFNASHLSEAVRNRLAAEINRTGYTGPRIQYTMSSGRNTPAPPLPEEVTSWSQETGQADLRDWGAFQTEPHARQFSQFLGRLRETSEYKNSTSQLDFLLRVHKLLVQLQENKDLRETCFNLAIDAVNTCGDRVALRLLNMETVCLDKRIETDIASGAYDHNPQALIDHCKGQYRQQMLADAASEKIKAMNFCDEIEVMLGFIVAFNNEFKLPVQMNTMLYPGCSGIKAMDLLSTRKKLTNQKLADQKLTAAEQTILALAERIRLNGVEQTKLTDKEKEALTGLQDPELSVEAEQAWKKEVSEAAKKWELSNAGQAENNRSFHQFLANSAVMHAVLKRYLPQEELDTLQSKIVAEIKRKKSELYERLEQGEEATLLQQEFDNLESIVTASVKMGLIERAIGSGSINTDLD